MSNRTPSILIVGHLCHDVAAQGYLPGGAAAYTAVVARQLGCQVFVLTSFAADYQFRGLFNQVALAVVPAAATTVFENSYTPNGRIQYLRSRASQLRPEDLPPHWPAPEMVLLGPIADEVSLEFVTHFPKALTCVCPQGWFRQWNGDGRILPKEISLDHWPERADVISLSEEDLAGKENQLSILRRKTKRLIVTRGAQGADLWLDNQCTHFPAAPANAVDATGAGDVFATAFTIHFFQNGAEAPAMKFAMSAAAKSVECSTLQELQVI